MRSCLAFVIVFFVLSAAAAIIPTQDDVVQGPLGLGVVGLSIAIAIGVRKSAGGPTGGTKGRGSGFVRRSVVTSNDQDAYHSRAMMRLCDSQDHFFAINAGLDAWDRFGWSFSAKDAIHEGFLAWEKAESFDPRCALSLSRELFDRSHAARTDGLALFGNLSILYAQELGNIDMRALASDLFEKACDLDWEMAGRFREKLVTKHGVGDMKRAMQDMDEYYRRQHGPSH